MKELRTVGLLLVAMIGAGIVGGILYGASRLEDKTITVLFVLLGVALAVAVASIGVGYGGAMLRKAGHQPKPEKHIYHTKERILDGRPSAPPQIIQAQPMTTPMLPELLRAAYQAGTRLPANIPAGRDENNEPLGVGWGDVWDGQIIDAEVEEVA